MQLSTKNSKLSQITITFDGGINVSEPAINIADNELQECVNLYYANQEKYLTTRMGLKIINAPKLTKPIEKLYEYVKDEDSIYLIAVSDGKIYYLKSTVEDEVETLSWEKIADLTNPTILPCFVTYSNLLIIADRGSTLHSWDGTTHAAITTSPSYVTIVETINGRLVCNSEATGELDHVYFSGPHNKDNWDTNNGAYGTPVGYGDGKKVTGLGVMVNYLVVFKEGGSTYAVNCSGAAENGFPVTLLFRNNSCYNQASIEGVSNDLVFSSDTGINTVQTVKEHGDLKTSFLGIKVASMLNGKAIRESIWSSFYGVLFLLVEGTDRVLVFHPHLGAYTTFDFGIRINSICNGRSLTYFADNQGYLYRNTNLSQDEFVDGEFTDINSRLVTKTFTAADKMNLIKTRVYLEQIDATKGTFNVIDKSFKTTTVLYDWLPSVTGKIYDATYKITDAHILLYGDAESYFDILNQYEDQAMSFSFNIELGRVKIKCISIKFNLTST